MKKIRNVGLMLGLMILFSSNSEAQYFYTSYGYAHDWYLPKYVEYTIHDQYYGYDVAHVRRYTRHGYTNFDVLLHRNGWYVELRINRHGRIFKTIRHHHYPLPSHRCTHHCGYHHAYYKTYYPRYHWHHNHAHHKTVYVNTYHGHGRPYHKHANYYTNVYVEKPQHPQGDRRTRSGINTNAHNQMRKSDAAIRKPQPTNRSVEYRKPQVSNNRIQHSSPQRTSYSTRSTTSSRNTTTYKNESGKQHR